MAERVPTEGGGVTEYANWQRATSAPRNISPEVMGRHKAAVFQAVMTGGFSINPELAGWDAYSTEKKKLIISGFNSVDDIRYVINRENDNDVLVHAISKKKELEMVASLASVPVK